MSKKILSLVLFLISVLAVSCSNADKTGSGDNNSGIGDGGTTPQGIAKYEGTWQLTDLVPTTILTISNNGEVTYIDKTSRDVTDKGNEIQNAFHLRIDRGDRPDRRRIGHGVYGLRRLGDRFFRPVRLSCLRYRKDAGVKVEAFPILLSFLSKRCAFLQLKNSCRKSYEKAVL